MKAPASLKVGERRYWKLWAAAAHALGTLTRHSTGGFVLLCQVAHRRDQVTEVLDREGITIEKVTTDAAGREHRETKAHPLLAQERALSQRLEQLLARYQLAALAKPAAPEQKAPLDDEDEDILRNFMSIR